MEALREIVDSEELQKIIKLPDSFKNRKLEIVIFPTNEEKLTNKSSKKAKGFLSKYRNVELIKEEDSAWENYGVNSNTTKGKKCCVANPRYRYLS